MKRKMIILSVIIIITILIASFIVFYLNNKEKDKDFITTINDSEKQIKLKDELVIKSYEKKEITITVENKSDEIYNYALYYINDNEKNNVSISIGQNINEKELKTNGSIGKEKILIPITISNSGNEDNKIKIGVKKSILTIDLEEKEIPINTYYTQKGSSPDLIEGMIPIFYDEKNFEWKKADKNNLNDNWYNYEKQKWANVVLVKSDVRDSYMSAKVGTKINENDILAFYVWVPRYKYQLFNVESQYIDPIQIEIEFQMKNDNKENGKQNGEWLTHPAFTFGSDELSGIWVGKFETTGTAEKPTILPNKISLTNQNVASQFTTAKIFGTEEYIEKKSINTTDAHMMKNIEWGAVAYLSQSKYGQTNKNKNNVIVNNNINTQLDKMGPTITGCASTKNDGELIVDNKCNTNYSTSYDDLTNGVLASTTRNIYGIYDMAGGSWEAVMATTKSQNNSILTGYDEQFHSGFTGIIYANGKNIPYNGMNIPDQKYYDLYENNFNEKNIILGDALGETNKWNNDFSPFGYGGSIPWIVRGGINEGLSEKAGIFGFIQTSGTTDSMIGFRSVITSIE